MSATNDASTPAADDPAGSYQQRANSSEGITLSEDMLPELGLADLPLAHRPLMLSYLYELLELRVGVELSKDMSENELDQFDKIVNSTEDEEAVRWLERNRPDYRDIVTGQWGRLQGQISERADQLLRISQRHLAMHTSAKRSETD